MKHYCLAALLGLSACLISVAPAVSAQPLTEDDLLGTWNWVESSGGLAGSTITPDESTWVRLEFREAGKLRANAAGTWIDGTYELDAGQPSQTLRIHWAQFPAPWPLMITESNFFVSMPQPGLLVLDEGCCDRFAHEFVRMGSESTPLEGPSIGTLKARWARPPR